MINDNSKDPCHTESNDVDHDESVVTNATNGTLIGATIKEEVSTESPSSHPTSDNNSDHNNNSNISSAMAAARYDNEYIKDHRPSPVAQAFFAALDIAEQQQQSLVGQNRSGTKGKSSLRIQKQIHTEKKEK